MGHFSGHALQAREGSFIGQADSPFVWRKRDKDAWAVGCHVVDAYSSISQKPDGDDGAEKATNDRRAKPLCCEQDHKDGHRNTIDRPSAWSLESGGHQIATSKTLLWMLLSIAVDIHVVLSLRAQAAQILPRYPIAARNNN